MGYDMVQEDQKFCIKRENMLSALSALRLWESDEVSKYPSSGSIEYKPLNNARSLVNALAELGWKAELDEQGNITGLSFTCEKLGDEEAWLSAIAPYVEKGSYLAMVGEDYEHWCWYFDGKTCVDYSGEVIYPGMPS